MVFNIRFLGSRTGHRMNARTSRVRGRRARRPVVEVLEGRALMAYIAVQSGAVLNGQAALGQQTKSVSIDATIADQNQEADLYSNVNDDNETNSVEVSTEGGYPTYYFAETSSVSFFLYMGAQYSNSLGPAYPETASAVLQNATAQIMPSGATERVNDPVSVTVTLQYVQLGNLNGSTQFSAGVGGTAASWSDTAKPGQTLPSITETETLNMKIGDKFSINFSGSLNTSGDINPGQAGGPAASVGQTVLLSLGIAPDLPVIAVNSLSWDTTQGGVDFGYTISNANLPQPTTAALYWAPTATFDSTQDTLIPGSVFTTATAAQTDPYTGHIDAATIGTPPPGTEDLLFVVDPNNQGLRTRISRLGSG